MIATANNSTKNEPLRWWNYEPENKLAFAIITKKDNWTKKKRKVVISTSPSEEEYEKAKERIIELCQNPNNEDAPNEYVERIALHTLKSLKANYVLPSLINATGDESLIFEFFVKDNFYLIEFYNSGEIVYLRRITGQPKFVSEINLKQLKEAITEISNAYNNVKLR